MAKLFLKPMLCANIFFRAMGNRFIHEIHIKTKKASHCCKTFSSEANGYVRGEGIGILLLKKLSAAEADGDHIYGVIRGSGINQDGKTNGITDPSSKSQERLERQV